MKFPLFASFIVFVIWLAYELNKYRNKEEKKNRDFWEKESAANNTRRKSLEDLNYITIPIDTLPMDILCDDSTVSDCFDTLHSLSDSPIVNFTGVSNTDLKLAYGSPNIDLLTRYDQCYTVLVRTLQTLGEAFYTNGYVSEAQIFLEFAVSTCTDMKSTYLLLSTIYKETNQSERILELIPVAQSINSSLKNSILKELEGAVETL